MRTQIAFSLPNAVERWRKGGMQPEAMAITIRRALKFFATGELAEMTGLSEPEIVQIQAIGGQRVTTTGQGRRHDH